MLDTTTRKAQQSTLSTLDAQSEQLVVEQIMQPFMGNQDWAQLVTPRVEEPAEDHLPAGVVGAGPDTCWLPDAGYATMAFLSGLS